MTVQTPTLSEEQPDQAQAPGYGHSANTPRLKRLSVAFDAGLKRTFDVLMAAHGLILISPLLVVVAVAIKLHDRGPVFYRPVRVGRGGQPFRLYKFRTMLVNADRLGPAITASGDRRITAVGRWLRSTKLDELPQLLNVLKGEMSLVGPRPEDPRYVAHYTPEQRRVLNARPGMTSAASLDYRHEEALLTGPGWEEVYLSEVMPSKLAIDLDYLRRRSFLSDLGLIAATVASMFAVVGRPVRSFHNLLAGMRNRHLLAVDWLIFLLLPFIALMLRTDGEAAIDKHGPSLLLVTVLFSLVKLAIFIKGGLYNRYWRYAGVEELSHIALLGAAAVAAQTTLFLWVLRPLGLVAADFPRSLPMIEGLLAVVAVGGLRYSVRLAERAQRRRSARPGGKRVVVAGAGSTGVLLVDELRRNPRLGIVPVAFVDDDPLKLGASIRGIPVAGRCDDTARVAKTHHAQEVIIAMPTASGKVIRRIVEVCEGKNLPTRTVPGMYEMLGRAGGARQLREVKIEDLLRREPITTDLASVRELVRGKRVLVTGGGGSIGSEICRQILQFQPESLIILGHGENSVFEIHNELLGLIKRQANIDYTTQDLLCGGAEMHSVIADIRFPHVISSIFEEYRPQVVFHSAAHKHVPLMEANVREAITNNVLGTRNLLDASLAWGVQNFVMISSDKAVNPVNVMGATKRVAELLVHQAAVLADKPYVAVRFGNVLGSRGSVVLTFKQQIAMGGPVTVTHPDMVRYFMTIPEAVQLVLQASTLARGGEVFMLDMGEPVKIVDLARDLIELSGLEVGKDIDIEFTGIRAGEKLYEELFLDKEQYEPTRHNKVYLLGNASNFVPTQLDTVLTLLEAAAQRNDKAAMLDGLCTLVPEFRPGGHAAGAGGRGLQTEPLKTFAGHGSSISVKVGPTPASHAHRKEAREVPSRAPLH